MDSRKTILVIDDEIDLLEMVQFQLEKKGFKVVTAPNGLMGLELLKTIAPDLVILDMNMPKIGGIEFYKKICDHKGNTKYPVFVLTARANMEQLFKELKVAGFMAKPFEINELIQEVEAIVMDKKETTKEKHGLGIDEVRKVCLVEDDEGKYQRLSSVFLEAGYDMSLAKTGTAAVNHINVDVPDLVLIKWKLSDIPGDVVIGKLQNIVKTKNVAFVLYGVPGGGEESLRATIGEGRERVVFTVSDNPDELLKIVDQSFRKAQ